MADCHRVPASGCGGLVLSTGDETLLETSLSTGAEVNLSSMSSLPLYTGVAMYLAMPHRISGEMLLFSANTCHQLS